MLNGAKTVDDLSAYAKKAAVKEAGINYLSGKLRKGLFDPKLEQRIENLKEGETSSVFFVEGLPYLARIVKIEKQKAKPLTDAYGEIKDLLTAQKYKEAVEQLKNDALAGAKIEYQ